MIQLLSGRSALLGDGFSRNPSNRDELIEQRTKDLKGVAGQTRGFNVDEFLSDWERTDGKPIPWTFPSDSVPVPIGQVEKVRELQGHFAMVQRADPLSVHVVECVSNVPVKPVVARYPLYQEVLSQQGVSTRLVVLYVPDYVSNAARLAKTSQMWQVLSRMLPT